jgi:hypothetical protein
MTTRRPSTKLVNQTDAVLPPSPVASLSLVARGEAMTTPGQARDEWNGVAAGYDQFATPLVIPLAEQVLGRVDVRRGTRLLDVAAGTGALSLAAARLGAHVVATDIAPAMIERLQARAQQERLKNLQGRVMDALEVLHITWVRRGLMKAGRPDRCSWRRYCVGHEAPDLAGRPVDLHAARDPHLRSAPVGVLSPATGPSVGDAGIGNSTSTTTGPFELPAMLLLSGRGRGSRRRPYLAEAGAEGRREPAHRVRGAVVAADGHQRRSGRPESGHRVIDVGVRLGAVCGCVAWIGCLWPQRSASPADHPRACRQPAFPGAANPQSIALDCFRSAGVPANGMPTLTAVAKHAAPLSYSLHAFLTST